MDVASPLRVGDKVRCISGGPLMVILLEKEEFNTRYFHCRYWFPTPIEHAGRPRYMNFFPEQVVRVYGD